MQLTKSCAIQRTVGSGKHVWPGTTQGINTTKAKSTDYTSNVQSQAEMLSKTSWEGVW